MEREPPSLRILTPPDPSRTVEIPGLRFTIGRRPDNDLVIPGQDISRLQAELIFENGAWMIADRGSTFGTWVNGHPAGRRRLRNRDTLTMGREQQIEIIFLHEDEASRILAEVDSRPIEQISQNDYRNLAILLEIVRKLSLMTSLQDMLELTLDATLEVTQADRGFIMLKDDSGTLQISAARRLDRAMLEAEGARFSESLVMQAALTGEPVYLTDIATDERVRSRASIEELALRSVICIPLKVPLAFQLTRPSRFPDNSPVLGVLYADSGSARSPLSPVVRQLIESIAAQASFAIENFILRQEDLERRLSDRDTEREMERLREFDRIKTEFLSNISHELRTPLTAIMGLIQNMLDGVSGSVDEKSRRHLARILDNAGHLNQIINDLLDLARIEAGGVALRVRNTSITRLLEDAVESLRPLAERRGLVLRVEPSGDEMTVIADRDRLMQVLFNLIGNAIKFTPQGGWVSLAAFKVTGCIRVEVADSGSGIPEGEMERVFDRFHQVQGSDGGKTGGTGLGLPIARSLIEMHGGSLWAEAAGTGTRFIFTVPVREPDTTTQASA